MVTVLLHQQHYNTFSVLKIAAILILIRHTGLKMIAETQKLLMPSNIHSSTPTVMIANTAPFLCLMEVCPMGVRCVPQVDHPQMNHCPEYKTVDTIASYNLPIKNTRAAPPFIKSLKLHTKLAKKYSCTPLLVLMYSFLNHIMLLHSFTEYIRVHRQFV